MKFTKNKSVSFNSKIHSKLLMAAAVGILISIPSLALAERRGGSSGRAEISVGGPHTQITVEKTWGREPKKVVVEEITYGNDRGVGKCGRAEEEDYRDRDDDWDDDERGHGRRHHHGWHREFDRHDRYGYWDDRRCAYNRRVTRIYHGY